MKQIIAIIKRNLLGRVSEALHQLPHFPGCTQLDAEGQSRGRGADGHYVAADNDFDAHPATVLLMACRDEDCEAVVDAIRRAAHTGLPGDGVIWVSDLAYSVRIGSDKAGNQAL
ncbi:MAG: P-II family nitrogen regulator [Gammaproteobacteria bacterium]|nr:P-II family nitrogen regulator [Gammaproteobacteria bacterium]